MVLLALLPIATWLLVHRPDLPWWNGYVWPWAIGDGFLGVFWTLAIIGSAIWLVVALANRAGHAGGHPDAAAGLVDWSLPSFDAVRPLLRMRRPPRTASRTARHWRHGRSPPRADRADLPTRPTWPLAAAAGQVQGRNATTFAPHRRGRPAPPRRPPGVAERASAPPRHEPPALPRRACNAPASHPLFSLIAIGVALDRRRPGAARRRQRHHHRAGGDRGPRGRCSPCSAVAIIVNGIIGKRSGGSCGLAVIVRSRSWRHPSRRGSHITVFGSSS